MKRIEEKPEFYLATAAKMLDAEEMTEAASLLRSATVTAEETGFDNWDGGTRIWTIFLEIDPAEFAQLGSYREALEEQIQNRLKPIVEKFTNDWFSVTLTPRVDVEADWREQVDELSAATRRNLIDGLMLDEVDWSGRLSDVEFLGRLFDLEALPSTDSRFSTASGDV